MAYETHEALAKQSGIENTGKHPYDWEEAARCVSGLLLYMIREARFFKAKLRRQKAKHRKEKEAWWAQESALRHRVLELEVMEERLTRYSAEIKALVETGMAYMDFLETVDLDKCSDSSEIPKRPVRFTEDWAKPWIADADMRRAALEEKLKRQI